jgi:hypothetical protein
MNNAMTNQVAICIPTYNQAQYLLESVGSACQQTYPNIEVWVCDDASTDETPEVMAELCQQFPQVRYHRHPHNLGIAGNNNWLLSQPKTEFIVRLDSDDILAPDYVEKLLKLLSEHPKAAYAHAAVQEIDEHGKPTRLRQLGSRSRFQNDEEAMRASISGYRVAANICMFRSVVLHQLGFYRTGLNFGEDWDLSVRIADAGWGNVYSPEVLACYRFWVDAGQVRAKRKQTELSGVIQVYSLSIQPAFERRGWNTEIIRHQRCQMALNYAIALDSPVYTTADKTTIVELLQEMGDSQALQRRIKLMHWGFGSYFRCQSSLKLKLKDSFKQGLTVLHNYGTR